MTRLFVALLLLATPAFALTPRLVGFTADDGTSFYVGTTADGALFVAPDAAPDDLYVLTPDCVATNAIHGTGSWGYEDAGWQISFNNRHEIRFPGQTPPIDPSDCQMLR
jgi:hypothetical protein